MSTINNPVGGAAGWYSFINLPAGVYYLSFDKGTYNFSPKDQGGNDLLDSDVNPLTGVTTPTSLTAGENDMSWDAGLYEFTSIGDSGGRLAMTHFDRLSETCLFPA